MQEEEKSREQLITELKEVRRCFDELAASEARLKKAEEETQLLKRIIVSINESEDLNAAFFAVLEKICRTTDWAYGEVWVPARNGQFLERSPVWYSRSDGLAEFVDLSEGFKFPVGKGLPGRVWSLKQPVWIKDVTLDDNFLRAHIAMEAGFKAGVAIPILARGEVIAVMAFYMSEAREKDERFIEIVSAVAAQLGLIIRRKKAEEEVRRSEEQYRSIFESSQDCICHISLDGNYLNMNAAGVALYEVDNIEDVIGNSSTASITENRKAAEEANTRAAAGDTVSLQYKSRGKKGREIWWDSKVVPIRRADGTVGSILRMSRDITERKKAEEVLIKVQKIESIGLLAGGIAHDFNNILAIMMANIILAKMKVDRDSETFKILDGASKACGRAKSLTQQLLTFSKGGEPVKKTIYIQEPIKESADLALSGSNCRAEYSLPGDLWPVDVDEGQMEQVVNNLIINATQAMPDGGVIRIMAKNTVLNGKKGLPLEKGEYVEISIQDQGAAMSEEHLKRVFEPYFTTKEKGYGLGLATSYSIIKRHGGHITAESMAGVGSSFHIYLPASKKEVPKKEETVETIVSGKGRILVMDDDKDLREITADLLRHIGYTVEGAKDGAEAIELYKKETEKGEPFDVLIMDLTIPAGMGGKEAIKELKKIDPDVKAIVSSGYSNDPIMADFGRYGFKGVVAKPYKIEDLSAVLNKVIREGS